MATIKLGNPPKNFKAQVKFKLLDGGEAVIEFVFTYRTRSQFGAFLDEIHAETGALKPGDDGDQSNLLEKAYQAGVKFSASQLMRAAEGWNLDVPFNEETVAELCDEYPAASAAALDAYRVAITEGRLGN